MFFPVLLILATIWTATDGALSCKTDKGLECVFPFKSSAGSSEYNQCKPTSKGRTWCATEVKANLVYSAWGYCNLDTCKEVTTVEEAVQKIETQGSCYACIEHVAYGPPPHWQSLECLEPCVSQPDKPACFHCLVRTATRQCLEPCGVPRVLDSFSLPAVGSETCTKITPVTAIQSSTSGGTHLGNKATDAIDGIAATISHTAGGETFPWIAVQLTDDGTSVPVKRVIIINRVQDVGFRLRKMQVFVADHAPSFSNKRFEGPGVQSIGPLFTGPGKDGEIIEVTSDIAKGRFVVLQMQDVNDILSLAEITTFSN